MDKNFPQDRSSFFSYLTIFKNILFRVQAWIGLLLFVALTVVVFLQVLTRYVFLSPLLWTEEVARYLLLWVVMTGAALSVQTQRHFVIEFFDYEVFKNVNLRKFMMIIPHIAFMLLALIMLISGTQYMLMSNIRAGRLAKIDMNYVYSSIPISGATIIFYCFYHIVSIFLGVKEERTVVIENEVE